MRWRNLIWPAFAFLLFVILCVHAGLGRYAHPVADDLSYALKDAGHGAWEAAKWEYLNWNGRFTSNYLVLFGPMREGFAGLMCYRWIPAMLIALNIAAMFSFLRVSAGGVLNVPHAFLGALIWLVLFVHSMPDIGEGLYWYTGSVTYTLAYPLVLVAVTLLLWNGPTPRMPTILFASVLLFLATGFNEVIMALLVVGSVSAITWRVLQRERVGAGYWLPLIAILAGAVLMMFAPGNTGRSIYFTGTHRLLPSVGMSLAQTVRFSISWLGCGSLLGLSLLWWLNRTWIQERAPRIARGFGLPPVFTSLALAAVIFLCAFPAYWSTGMLGQHRTMNTACFFFLPLWFINLAAWTERFTHLRSPWRPDVRLTTALLLLIVADLAFSGNSASAFSDAFTGRAERFDVQMHERYRLLEKERTSHDKVAGLPLIDDPPHSLYVLDLRDPTFLTNVDYAAWFGLNAVRIDSVAQSDPANATN